jgi:hypothetical protein
MTPDRADPIVSKGNYTKFMIMLQLVLNLCVLVLRHGFVSLVEHTFLEEKRDELHFSSSSMNTKIPTNLTAVHLSS